MTAGHSILLADDEEGDVVLFRLAMLKAGMDNELIVARDGQEAVELLRSFPGSGGKRPMPALFLLDLKMPGLDGFDVLEWMSGDPELRQLPVLILSSSSDEHDVQRAMSMGARDYLVKPTGVNALAALLRDVQKKWLEPANGEQRSPP